MDEQSADGVRSNSLQPDAALWERARLLADAYQVVLRVENGSYIGRGVELPEAEGRGISANACMKATRAALATEVLRRLESWQTPPTPEFPFSPAPVGRPRRWAVRWARWLALAVTGVCVVAMLTIAAAGAKTVVFSGPVIAIMGVVVLVLGLLGRYWWAVGLGASYLAICGVFVVMVNVFRLSPRSAYVPFLCVGVPYVLGLIAGTIVASRRMPREERPWECEGCGYLLVGLSEPRCPECGRGFDPRRWAGVPAPGAAVGAA
jgi:hypothetical protein